MTDTTVQISCVNFSFRGYQWYFSNRELGPKEENGFPLEDLSRIMINRVYQKWQRQQNHKTEMYRFELVKSEPVAPKNDEQKTIDNEEVPQKKPKGKKRKQKPEQIVNKKIQPPSLPRMILAEDLPALSAKSPECFPTLKYPFPVTDPKELSKLWTAFNIYEVGNGYGTKNMLYRPFAPKIVYKSTGPYGLFYDRHCFAFTRVLPLPSELRVYSNERAEKVRKAEKITETLKTNTEYSCRSSEAKSSMEITDLPDDILLNILDQFSLQFKLSLRAVSRNFSRFIENSLVVRKRSLKLFSYRYDCIGYCKLITSNNLESFEHIKLKDIPADDDVILKVDQYTVPLLSQMYSNLETLVVYFSKESKVSLLD